MVYLLMFLLALLSASLLPISSEATLLYYIENNYNITLLFLSAGLGNVLGSIINYWIGSKGASALVESNKISKERLFKSQQFFDKYGGYSLLLSWVPVIGDPLTFIAGIVNFNFKKFVFIVTIAKFGRYAIIILGYQSFL